ncbi:Protein of unknown function, partial [Gryllus bimaculatus]
MVHYSKCDCYICCLYS